LQVGGGATKRWVNRECSLPEGVCVRYEAFTLVMGGRLKQNTRFTVAVESTEGFSEI